MAFMRDLFYLHGAAQPRTRRYGQKTVTEQPTGPDALAAIKTDGSVVVIEMTDPDWHEKGSAIPSAEIIGTAFRNRKDQTWSGHFTAPHGNNQTIKDSVGRTSFASADLCGASGLACRLEAFNAELAVLADPVAHLTRELKSHDWYCHMSDAPGVCGAGECHMRQIRKIMEDIDPATVREVWAANAPAEFACPV